MSDTTKNLGDRKKVPVRMGTELEKHAKEIARQTSLPVNAVLNVAMAMLSAQFAPLIRAEGLSLDLLQEEINQMFADARRVVDARPVEPRKLSG